MKTQHTVPQKSFRSWNRREQAILDQIKMHLETVEEMHLDAHQLNQAVTLVAGLCFTLSKDLETKAERKQANQLSQLMNDELGQLFSTLLTDRIPRLSKSTDVTTQANHVLSQTGIPPSMPILDKVQLAGLAAFGAVAPELIGRAIQGRIRKEAQTFLMPGEQELLQTEVRSLKTSGVKVNVNQLGEEVLGEQEAQHHMDAYLALLETPDVDTISVKVSSICAQLSVLAFDTSLARVCDALRRLYRKAKKGDPQRAKLVMLDMEAYRDLELTFCAFTSVLDEDEFKSLRAGIVLQAYLPDSHAVHERLIKWAEERVVRGGAPVQLRLVKGANLAVESIESAIAGWPLPIFSNKVDVDASFKLMVERALTAENLKRIKLGIASHNLFDVAYALCLTRQRRLDSGVHFEVLSGMAGGLSRVLLGLGCDVLVYSPAVRQESLHAAVAYLVRRLDENTADQNFLRHSFDMTVGDDAWRSQEQAFVHSRRKSLTLDLGRRRKDRTESSFPSNKTFRNAPDTDFTLKENRTWLKTYLEEASVAPTIEIRSCAHDDSVRHETIQGRDPSIPQAIPYIVHLATAAEVNTTIEIAEQTTQQWRSLRGQERTELLRQIAHGIEKRRGELIAALVKDGGKAVLDADAEVSEAVDFCRYYAMRFDQMLGDSEVTHTAKGVTVITPPWNFPFAIPLGGVVAGLVSGNPVILKPALETALIASKILSICKEAGVPPMVLQMVVATDEHATALITDERVQTVVLTGGTSTARLFRRLRPDLNLLAETGGKNATIVTHFADRDLAINAVIQSAFGHAGQKCSATSLLILTRALADDSTFKAQLIDATQSMVVGPAWDLSARVTPLIQPPTGVLLRGLTELEQGETWWLEPKPSEANPALWSPGIKGGVRPGSFGHVTEFFGPLLCVMVAENLTQAIEWANSTPYGLTAGLHSLNEEEQKLFVETMDAGNLYVNRTTTGAIVQRQPFGGRKDSCFGPGAKAGGPNYLSMFVNTSPASIPNGSIQSIPPKLQQCVEAWRALNLDLTTYTRATLQAMDSMKRCYDPTGLRGQDNIFRYQFSLPVLVIAFSDFEPEELAKIHISLAICAAPFKVCLAGSPKRSTMLAVGQLLGESLLQCEWQEALRTSRIGHIRALGEIPADLYPLAQHARCVDRTPVSTGLGELKKYGLEQSISIDYHRYGHLGIREHQPESILGVLCPSPAP